MINPGPADKMQVMKENVNPSSTIGMIISYSYPPTSVTNDHTLPLAYRPCVEYGHSQPRVAGKNNCTHPSCRGRIATFYRKPVSSPFKIMYRSALNKQTKRASLLPEGMRMIGIL